MAPLYSIKSIEEMASGDLEFIEKMKSMFAELSPALVNRIKTSFQQKDFDDVRAAAHKLKPSIDMLEILTIKQVIRDIETGALNREKLEEMENWIQVLETTINEVVADLMSN